MTRLRIGVSIAAPTALFLGAGVFSAAMAA